MDISELRERLLDPGESGTNAEDIAALLNAYDSVYGELNALTESSTAKIAEMQSSIDKFGTENQALKAKNYDLIMAQPQAKPNDPEPPKVTGINSLFERK